MNETNKSDQVDGEEEIIELTNIVTDDTGNEEEVVELSDIVSDDSAAATESPDSESDESGEPIVYDDFDDDFDDVTDDDDDFTGSLGMEIGDEEEEESQEAEVETAASETPAPITTETGEQISLSPEQIDAAMERVITNLYKDKIESIIVSAIEKAVTKEIDKIKATLLED